MKAKHHFVLYTLLAAVAVLAVVYGFQQASRAERSEGTVADLYDSALLSSIKHMDDIDVNLSKLLIAGDNERCVSLLTDIARDAQDVQASLGMLPLSHVAMSGTLRFVSQVSDYAATLSALCVKGTALTDGDIKNIGDMQATCQALRALLDEARKTKSAWITEESAYYLDADSSARPLEKADSSIEYPTLIYDGPFSDARDTGTPRGLGTGSVTAEQAAEIARAFAGAPAGAAEYAMSLGGIMPAHGVTVSLADDTLTVAVTQTGGHVLWMAPEHASFSIAMPATDCIERAAEFLAARGYGRMEPTYWQVYGGLTVVNFAAVQGDYLLYPDLVKVQVRMDTGEVVGLEAHNYLMNHCARELPGEIIGVEEAQGAVSERLAVKGSRLCVIPADGGERACYEFTGEYGGETYLVYIDALTALEIDIQRVIQTDNGVLCA